MNNYTNLDEAYHTHHVSPNTYKGSIKYSPVCIYCSYILSKQLMNDGGSFRQCYKCKKNFKATIITEPIYNFSYSTYHLQGTN